MIMEQHLGVVIANNTDLEKRGGLKVRVDTLLTDFEYPELFYPVFPANMLKIPEVGEIVEVMVISDLDDLDSSDDNDLGTVEFSDYCFWTGRTFDATEGIVPQDLLQNYPKRSGIYWNKDGTIIYHDSTPGAVELTIAVTNKKTLVQLKENYVLLQQDQIKVEMQNGKFTITNSGTEIGASGASEPIMLGNIVYNAFFNATSGLTTLWLAAATALAGSPDPTGAAAQAYGTAMQAALQGFIPTGANWRSTKHKVDQ